MSHSSSVCTPTALVDISFHTALRPYYTVVPEADTCFVTPTNNMDPDYIHFLPSSVTLLDSGCLIHVYQISGPLKINSEGKKTVEGKDK